MPLQFSPVGKMPLQKLDLEICHSNFFIPLLMPFSPFKRIRIQKIHVFQCVLQYLPNMRRRLVQTGDLVDGAGGRTWLPTMRMSR
jgi:hypothetical protein